MPKFSETTNHQYLWKGLSDFVDFLQVVICTLLDINWSDKNMLFLVCIVRHRLSANQTIRYFKLKQLEKDMRYQVDFLLRLKLEEICYFGLWPQNTLGQSVAGFLTFDLFDLWNLIPGVHYYIVLVSGGYKKRPFRNLPTFRAYDQIKSCKRETYFPFFFSFFHQKWY